MSQDLRSPGPAEVRLRHPRAADVRHRSGLSFGTIAKSAAGLVALAAIAMLVVLLMPALMQLSGEFRCSPEPRTSSPF